MSDACCGSETLAALEGDEAALLAVQSIHAGRHFEVSLAAWPRVRQAIVRAMDDWDAHNKLLLVSLARVALAKHDEAYAQRGARTEGSVTPAKGPGMIGAV